MSRRGWEEGRVVWLGLTYIGVLLDGIAVWFLAAIVLSPIAFEQLQLGTKVLSLGLVVLSRFVLHDPSDSGIVLSSLTLNSKQCQKYNSRRSTKDLYVKCRGATGVCRTIHRYVMASYSIKTRSRLGEMACNHLRVFALSMPRVDCPG